MATIQSENESAALLNSATIGDLTPAPATAGPTVGGLEATPALPYGATMVDVTTAEYHRGRTPEPNGKTYPAEILTPDEVKALAAQCSTTSGIGIRYRALIVLLYPLKPSFGDRHLLPDSAVPL